MKICILTYRANPYSGGQGIYLKCIAEELVRQGHSVHAIVGPPYPSAMEGVEVHKLDRDDYFVKGRKGISNYKRAFRIFQPLNFYEFLSTRVGSFPEISTFGFRIFKYLKNLHRDENFDIILDNQCLSYGLLMLKSFGIPVVATIHHPLSVDLKNVLERSGTFKKKRSAVMFYPLFMQSFVAKRLDHIITVSEDSKKLINRYFGVPMELQSVVYNGIDATIFQKIDGIKKIDNQILFVGNSEDGKKGLIYLLKALSLMKNIDVNLVVVDGGTPHHNISFPLVKQLGLGHRVKFTGKISMDELVRYYNESEIAIVPSVYEGFGLPAGEAMACGTAVISSDGGALPEVVGDAGVVVPARDSEALAIAIDELIVDKERIDQLGKMGKLRVNEIFNWSVAVKEMIAIFNKLK